MKTTALPSLLFVSVCLALANVSSESVAAATQFDPAAPLTPAVAAQLSQNVNRPVIVIMKNRLIGADAASDQEPVLSELRQVNATRLKPYRLVNAFAATVSDGEVARLKANPAVAQVVPDMAIHLKPRALAAARTATTSPNGSTSPTLNVVPGACGPDGKVLLEPEALQTTHTDSDDSRAKTARSLGFSGAGVKLATMSDGLDPNNVNFIRPNGTSAIVDYEDFSGDGPDAVDYGVETWLDSTAIVGQGLHVYDVSDYSAQPDPSACNIRIEGMAPNASLVVLKVFSAFNYSSLANILQAIDYAVFVDHVDVINESIGQYSFPDATSQDIWKQFDDAAVAAGVTVVTSNGDSGHGTNVINNLASDPLVISVGATTTFRSYLQTNFLGARYFATTGWLNDNIAQFSSGGFTETGRTLDLVAPGDGAFSSCEASPTFQGCYSFAGNPSDVLWVDGTSLSSPLTAGGAALVIEAYRKTHRGASPTPALVKQILTSTATDLGAPATEEGAGLLNAYKAVQLAQSAQTGDGSPAFVGESLLLSESQLNAVGAPGTTATWQVTVTNTGTDTQSVQVTGRTFGASENVQTGSETLNTATSPVYVDMFGDTDTYAIFTFNVRPGSDRLNALFADSEPVGVYTYEYLILIDPKGRYAAGTSAPLGNFGNVDVREPDPGVWTGVIAGLVDGIMPWQVSTQRFVPFASVTPASFSLAPGQSQTIQVSASTPPTPGDSAGSIVLTSSQGGFDRYVGAESNSIPITLRSLVDVAHGGTFSGVLTGGDSFSGPEAQNNYYQFKVDPGRSSITANVSLENDAGENFGAYLINPYGVAVGFGQNSLNGTNGLSLTAYTLNPVAGMWTLIVAFDNTVGNEIAQRFTGNITLDDVSAGAPGLPTSEYTKLPAGVPVTIPVSIANKGAAPQSLFIDARLNTKTSTPLANLSPPPSSSGYPLPLSSFPEWLVPTQTSSVTVAASANVPIELAYGAYAPCPCIVAADPEFFGPPTATTTAYNAAGSYTPKGGIVTPGNWYSLASEIGPYPDGAPAGLVNESLSATMKPFDPAVTSSTGDFWLGSVEPAALGSFTPMTVNPGQSVVINVTITPTGTAGTVVGGTLYVDSYVSALPPGGQATGDELAAIPYSYTIQ
jgi:hypothetical protein